MKNKKLLRAVVAFNSGSSMSDSAARAIVANSANTLTEGDLAIIAKVYARFADVVQATFGTEDHASLAWVQLAGEMMGAMQSINVSGNKKKDIMLAVLRQIVDNEIDGKYRESAHVIIDNMISPAIDMAVVYRTSVKSWFKRKCSCC